METYLVLPKRHTRSLVINSSNEQLDYADLAPRETDHEQRKEPEESTAAFAGYGT